MVLALASFYRIRMCETSNFALYKIISNILQLTLLALLIANYSRWLIFSHSSKFLKLLELSILILIWWFWGLMNSFSVKFKNISVCQWILMHEWIVIDMGRIGRVAWCFGILYNSKKHRFSYNAPLHCNTSPFFLLNLFSDLCSHYLFGCLGYFYLLLQLYFRRTCKRYDVRLYR